MSGRSCSGGCSDRARAVRTWDNATLLCETDDPRNGGSFPLTLKTQRIAPGETNSWNLKIKGLKACARFSTREPNTLWLLEWRQVSTGYTPLFPAITGGIFEFGFTDAILQMWAAYLTELSGQALPQGLLAQAATPAEANLSHRLFTAALQSQENGQTVEVGACPGETARLEPVRDFPAAKIALPEFAFSLIVERHGQRPTSDLGRKIFRRTG